MTLASDLMGLGMPPMLAAKIAQGGIGPVTITAAGTTYATSTKLGVEQSVVGCSNANNTLSIGLPPVGGDTGVSIADEIIVGNTSTTDSLVLRASTGVLISAGGAQDSVFVVSKATAIALYPLSSTLWLGIKGT